MVESSVLESEDGDGDEDGVHGLEWIDWSYSDRMGMRMCMCMRGNSGDDCWRSMAGLLRGGWKEE